MADNMICFRVQPEIRAMAIVQSQSQGITLSEFTRAVFSQGVTGQGFLGGVDEGYTQARGLVTQLMHAMVRAMADHVPPTFEEAVMRFGLAPPPGMNGQDH